MSDRTHIEWTDATWNIITGCSVVSAGCKHCYAMKLAGTRLAHHPSREGLTIATAAGPVWNGEVRFNEQWLRQPLEWTKPRRIFVCAHGDLFHEDVPDEWIDRVFAVMAQAPHHTFQLLTKRSARAREYLNTYNRLAQIYIQWCGTSGEPEEAEAWPLPNVWLGVSVEDADAAAARMPDLVRCEAAVRWISAEPLLGPPDLARWLDPWTCSDCGYHGCEEETGPCTCAVCGVEAVYAEEIGSGRCPQCGKDDGTSDDVGGTCPKCESVRGWSRDYGFKFNSERRLIDWVVVGGESGPGARPMNPQWVRDLRDQCAAAGVPFLFKQWGNWVSVSEVEGAGPHHTFPDGRTVRHVGKRRAGRTLDGVEHNGFPEVR